MNILLVEDHPIFRFGVRQVIRQRWPDAVVGEAGNMAEALAAARGGPWQVAVADLHLPDAAGVEIVSRLLRAAPAMHVLVLSLNAEAAYAQRVLQMGAAGYLSKDKAAGELAAALERVMGGGRYISAALAEQMANRMAGQGRTYPHDGLSTQEYRVMLQLALGRRVGDIAASMNLSPKTVSTYRGRILEKLDIASNAELARYCVGHGLLDGRPPETA